jgi:uncharacterized protein
LAVNGGFHKVLADYETRISAAGTGPMAQRLQREAARKAIRSTNIPRHETDTECPVTLGDHVVLFCQLFVQWMGQVVLYPE